MENADGAWESPPLPGAARPRVSDGASARWPIGGDDAESRKSPCNRFSPREPCQFPRERRIARPARFSKAGFADASCRSPFWSPWGVPGWPEMASKAGSGDPRGQVRGPGGDCAARRPEGLEWGRSGGAEVERSRGEDQERLKSPLEIRKVRLRGLHCGVPDAPRTPGRQCPRCVIFALLKRRKVWRVDCGWHANNGAHALMRVQFHKRPWPVRIDCTRVPILLLSGAQSFGPRQIQPLKRGIVVKKLTLDLNELHVESFEPSLAGTVTIASIYDADGSGGHSCQQQCFPSGTYIPC